MKRNFGRNLALALIGQAIIRIMLKGTAKPAGPADLFWSGVAIVFLMMMIGLIFDAVASARETRTRLDLS